MRTERVPLCAWPVSTVTVPVPEQSGVLTDHRPDGTVPVWLSNPSQNAAVPQPAGGGPVSVGVGLGLVGVGDALAPLHGTPSRAKSTGTAVAAELVAWKPKATVPPPASVPL